MNILSKESVLYAALFAVGAGGSAYLHDLYNKAEAGYMCYHTFSHIEFMGSGPEYGTTSEREQYYRSVRPLLKDLGQDKKITNEECSILNNVYDQAQDINQREERIKSLEVD